MADFIIIERCEALELCSIGLVSAGLNLPEESPERARLQNLISDLSLPAVLTEYFHQAGSGERAIRQDQAKARCLLQATPFIQRPFEDWDFSAFLKGAELANLTEVHANAQLLPWLQELPSQLAALASLPSLEPVLAAYAFAFQTQQIRYRQIGEAASQLIMQFSGGRPRTDHMVLLPNPLQIPGMTFISKEERLYLQLSQPTLAQVLKAYIHLAMQPYRMQVFELSWRSGPAAVMDLSSLALRGQARETSLEATLRQMEAGLVDCLLVLLMPGTVSEKKAGLAELQSQGNMAAGWFIGFAHFPVYEAELPAYIRELGSTRA